MKWIAVSKLKLASPAKGREPINVPGEPLAKVRYAPVATKFRTAPNDAMANS